MKQVQVETPIGPVAVDSVSEAQAFIAGYNHALLTFGIYRNGVLTIGCLEKPIKEELLKDHHITIPE